MQVRELGADDLELICRHREEMFRDAGRDDQVLKTTLETIPPAVYLKPDPARQERWRGRLAGLPGLSFVSLQKGRGEEEARAPAAGQPLLRLGSEIDDFADSAALLTQLDLLICVDTAVAHLAGALGVPCCVLLPAVGTDWRWLRDSGSTAWYPESMRLFRQAAPGDWAAPMAALQQVLADMACSARTG